MFEAVALISDSLQCFKAVDLISDSLQCFKAVDLISDSFQCFKAVALINGNLQCFKVVAWIIDSLQCFKAVALLGDSLQCFKVATLISDIHQFFKVVALICDSLQYEQSSQMMLPTVSAFFWYLNKIANILQMGISNAFSCTFKFIREASIDNITALVQAMFWCWTGNKPLPEPTLTKSYDAKCHLALLYFNESMPMMIQ